MIVADSSYLVEGLMKRKELLDDDIVTSDLAIYEVFNSVWKHQHVLRDLEDGQPYLSVFTGLLDSNSIRAVHPDKRLLSNSYAIAARNRISVYDAVFISIALEIGAELRTFDKRQARIMRLEA